jgi:DNA-directed RNA polymerase specialized sigma24 family protein
MPTSEQLEIIQKVIARISSKHKFSYYEIEDIKQEAFIIACEALENYDSSRPLENFIARHISNRLKTLRRNKYFRQNTVEGTRHHSLNESKKALMDLVSLSDDSGEIKHDISYEVDFDKISTTEALNKVLDNLSPQMRSDFMKLANGVTVKFHKKEALFKKVREILNEDW